VGAWRRSNLQLDYRLVNCFARIASLEKCFEGAGAKVMGHLAALYVKLAGYRR
jgi:hypothetical protein